MAKEKGNLLRIKELNKAEKLKQLASYCTKLLEDSFLENGVKAFATST
jgi:hypothetical protein